MVMVQWTTFVLERGDLTHVFVLLFSWGQALNIPGSVLRYMRPIGPSRTEDGFFLLFGKRGLISCLYFLSS